MKKIIINSLIQLVLIYLIIEFVILDDLSQESFALLLFPNIFYLFLFIIFIKFFASYIFFLIINLVSNIKNNFISVSSIILQGGVINQIIPGVGYIFNYYKLKSNSNNSLIEYSISQSIFSIGNVLAYFVLALISGFIYFSRLTIIFNKTNLIILTIIFFFFFLYIFIFRKKIYSITKKNFLKIRILENTFNELKIVKDNIFKDLYKFLFIFICIIIKSIFECIAFYIALRMFGADISFMASNYTWIISSLAMSILLINYFGLFELALVISSTFLIPEFDDMTLFALSFKALTLVALVAATIIALFLSIIFNLKSNNIQKRINRIRLK